MGAVFWCCGGGKRAERSTPEGNPIDQFEHTFAEEDHMHIAKQGDVDGDGRNQKAA